MVGILACAKEFMVVPIGGIPCWVAERDVSLPTAVMSLRERLKGEAALRESIEVTGDTPSDKFDFLCQL